MVALAGGRGAGEQEDSGVGAGGKMDHAVLATMYPCHHGNMTSVCV